MESGNPGDENTRLVLTENKEYKINKDVISTFNKDTVLECKTDDSCIFKGQCRIFLFSFYPVPECKYPTYGDPPELQV